MQHLKNTVTIMQIRFIHPQTLNKSQLSTFLYFHYQIRLLKETELFVAGNI